MERDPEWARRKDREGEALPAAVESVGGVLLGAEPEDEEEAEAPAPAAAAAAPAAGVPAVASGGSSKRERRRQRRSGRPHGRAR